MVRILAEAVCLVCSSRVDEVGVVAAMENTSLLGDVWNNVTTSSSEYHGTASSLLYARNLALRIVYAIIGTVGVLDNLFVIIIFVFFVKITEKVLSRPAEL